MPVESTNSIIILVQAAALSLGQLVYLRIGFVDSIDILEQN